MFAIIPDFSDYEINEAGDIVCTVDHHQYTGRRAVQQGQRHGIAFVQIVNDEGQRRAVSVRSLVLLTFRGEKPVGTRIVHRDGNTLNHRLSNLDYAPLKTLQPKSPKPPKERWRKLTPEKVSEIRRLLGEKVVKREIAKRFAIDPSMVTLIGNGKRHAGVGAL
jgi:hypothetical protein